MRKKIEKYDLQTMIGKMKFRMKAQDPAELMFLTPTIYRVYLNKIRAMQISPQKRASYEWAMHTMGTMQRLFRFLSRLNNCKTFRLEQIKHASSAGIFFLRCFRLLKGAQHLYPCKESWVQAGAWWVPTNTRFWPTRVLRSRKHITITQGTESTNKHMKWDQQHTNKKKDELWPSVGETSRVIIFIGEFFYPQRLYMSKGHQLPQSRFRLEKTIK